MMSGNNPGKRLRENEQNDETFTIIVAPGDNIIKKIIEEGQERGAGLRIEKVLDPNLNVKGVENAFNYITIEKPNSSDSMTFEGKFSLQTSFSFSMDGFVNSRGHSFIDFSLVEKSLANGQPFATIQGRVCELTYTSPLEITLATMLRAVDMPSQQLVMANRESEIHERGDYDVLPGGNIESGAVDQQYALTSPAATISVPPASLAPSSSRAPNWDEMWRKLGSELNEQGNKLDELGRQQNELGLQQIEQGHKLDELGIQQIEQGHKLNELDRKLSEQGHQLAAILASIERLKPSGQAFVQPADSTSSEDGED